jgi:dimethylamine/trimethylamine dehydrogenase
MGHLKDAPDLFDVKMDYSSTDCAPSRFLPEGSHRSTVEFMKTVTDKPVVGVGRFTSPDTMVAMVKGGVLDLIGGARPSIADPFLPVKIDEGREEDIRECIGCNICISSWHDGVWVRCTQNPTAGEEWRRGWHPEVVRRDGEGDVLVVGGGPAGLESALVLARRGFRVALAEAEAEFGGRLRWETALPGLRQWGRVADYRLGQLRKMPNVSLYPGSRLSADEVVDFGSDHVVVATGARWTRALCGANELPVAALDGSKIYTPDDLGAGAQPEGPVVVFDFDNYYLGTAVAEDLAARGLGVTYVTTSGAASAWSFLTNEQPHIHTALARRGIGYRTLEIVTGYDGQVVRLAQIMSGEPREVAARSLVIVGMRAGGSALFDALQGRVASLHLTGDANAPGAIAHAVWQGRRTGEDLARGQVMVRRDPGVFAPREAAE